jgi:hypothetical protein
VEIVEDVLLVEQSSCVVPILTELASSPQVCDGNVSEMFGKEKIDVTETEH